MATKRQKKIRNRKIVWCVVFLLLFIGAGLIVWGVLTKMNENSAPAQSERKENEVNYEAPSKEELDVGESIKKEGQTEAENEDSEAQKTGTVFIVDASQYEDEIEVRARIDGLVEEGGLCEFTFSKEGEFFNKTQTGLADAKSTSCGTLVVPVDEFATSGGWAVTVSYQNATKADARIEVTK